MSQWNFNDGIVPFLMCIAFYVLSAVTTPLSQQWKEAKRKLAFWREYEARIGAPDEAISRYLANEGFLAIEEMFLQQGFRHLGNYVLTTGSQIQSTTSAAPLSSPDTSIGAKEFRFERLDISRVYEHREYGCNAFVTASSGGSSTANIQIVSSGGGWTYTSTWGEGSVDIAGQSARSLSSYHDVSSVEELVKVHLDRRAEIAQVGGFTWSGPMTMEQVVKGEEEHAARVRQFGRSHSPLSLLIKEAQAKQKPRREWLGELEGKL